MSSSSSSISSSSSSSSSSVSSSSRSSSSSSTYIQTLDPYANILDNLSRSVTGLEVQRDEVVPEVLGFRTAGLVFPPEDVSPRTQVDDALEEFKPEAIKAGVTDVALINDLVDDCYNEAVAAIRRYTNKILGNIENGISRIDEIIALPENLLMEQLQKVWKLTDSIQGLIGAMDSKINCVADSSHAPTYIDQIQGIEDRIDEVLDNLKLDPVTGAFDQSILMDGFDIDLSGNLDAYKLRADELQLEIANNILQGTNIPPTVNPKKRF